MEDKTKLVNDIISLLQIRDKGEEQKEMMDEWLLFIVDYKLSAMEIYQAHKMAVKRELLDDKGNEIECIAILSTNTTGKILSSYHRWKKANIEYHNGKKLLQQFLNPTRELTEIEKKNIEIEFLKTEWNRLQTDGNIMGSNIFYQKVKIELGNKITLDFVDEVLKKYYLFKENKIKNPEQKRDKKIVNVADKMPLKTIENYSPIVHFENCVVMKFIEAKKLKDYSLNEWTKYWIKINK